MGEESPLAACIWPSEVSLATNLYSLTFTSGHFLQCEVYFFNMQE